jgi:UDP-N-acetylmuramoylalanine--D-glutamate ligase
MEDLKNKRVVVAGLGNSAGRLRRRSGSWRRGRAYSSRIGRPPQKLASSVKELDGLPIEFRLGEHRVEDFTSADLIVTSPAIPPHNEFIAAARAADVPVTTEIRLFIERCPTKNIVGITGTKGKSTTTALLGRMLATKFTTHVGGEHRQAAAARPCADQAGRRRRPRALQLYARVPARPAMAPHVAVVTMLSSDHLDWHGSAEAYLDAKKLIVRFQKPCDIAVLAEGGEHSAELRTLTRAQVATFSTDGKEKFSVERPRLAQPVQLPGRVDRRARARRDLRRRSARRPRFPRPAPPSPARP